MKKRKVDSTAGKGGDGGKMDRAIRGVRPGSAEIPAHTSGHQNDTISRLRGGRGADVPGVKREPHVVTGLQPVDGEWQDVEHDIEKDIEKEEIEKRTETVI